MDEVAGSQREGHGGWLMDNGEREDTEVGCHVIIILDDQPLLREEIERPLILVMAVETPTFRDMTQRMREYLQVWIATSQMGLSYQHGEPLRS